MPRGLASQVTFVLGGVRSGKSRYAQRIASRYRNVVFIATATASDAEMEERIERHRRNRPTEWQTLEVPIELDAAISTLHENTEIAVVDCLTLYISNLMTHTRGEVAEIEAHTNRVYRALENARNPIVLVSNEVGSGLHPLTQSGRLYCDLLGELNQQVAQLAEAVIFMKAGIPVPIKGRLPATTESD